MAFAVCLTAFHHIVNDLYDHDRLRSAIRTAFYARRTLATNEQVIQQHAQLLVADALTPALPKHLYPPAADVQAILLGDSEGKHGEQLAEEYRRGVEKLRADFAQFAGNPFVRQRCAAGDRRG